MKTFTRSAYDRSRPESRDARLIRQHRKIGNLSNYAEGADLERLNRILAKLSRALRPLRERQAMESRFRESERMLRTWA
jgi:hypothetical protein